MKIRFYRHINLKTYFLYRNLTEYLYTTKLQTSTKKKIDQKLEVFFDFINYSVLHKISNVCNKIRKDKIVIEPHDTFNVDHTLARIIYPLLIQLRDNKHGSPTVEPKDVPKHLRPTAKEIKLFKSEGITDNNFHLRWIYVLNKMIFAFEKIRNDEYDVIVFDEKIVSRQEAFKISEAIEEDINEGLKLFGKYYRALWD